MSLVSVRKLLEVLERINNRNGATLKQLIRHWRKCINVKDVNEYQLALQMRNVIYSCVKHGLVKHCSGYYTLAHKKTPKRELDEGHSEDSEINVAGTGHVLTKSEDELYNGDSSDNDCDRNHECSVNHYSPLEDFPCQKHYHQRSASYTNNYANYSKCPYFYPHCIHSCLKRSLKHLNNKHNSQALSKYIEPEAVMMACKSAVQRRRSVKRKKSNTLKNRRCCKRYKRCKSCGQMTVEEGNYESETSLKDDNENKADAKNKKRSEYELRKRKPKVKSSRTKEKQKKQRKKMDSDNGTYFIGPSTTYQPNKRAPSPPPFSDDKEVGVNGLEQKDSNHSNPPVFNAEDNEKTEDDK